MQAGGNKAMNDSVAPSASVTNLLTDIRKGKQLKKVDPDELNIASMDETEVPHHTLAVTITSIECYAR